MTWRIVAMGRTSPLIVALLALMLGVGAWGDAIYLKNGKKTEGEIVSQGDGMTVLKTGGQVVKLPSSLIERVETTTPDASSDLCNAARLTDNGRFKDAFEICEKIRTSEDADADLKREATVCWHRAVHGGRDKVLERYTDLLVAGKVDKCIAMIEELRSGVAEKSFDDHVLRHCTSDMRLTLAERGLDRMDHGEAVAQIDEMEKLGVECPGLQARMGAILLEVPQSGASQRAIDFLGKALAEDPSDDEARVDLICALADVDRTREVVKAWEEAPQGFADSALWTKDDLDAVGRAMRAEGFTSLRDGLRQRAMDLYNRGMDRSLPSVSLYEEAVQFYAMAGDNVTADRMADLLEAETQRRDEMYDLTRARRAAFAAQARESRERALSSSSDGGDSGSGDRDAAFQRANARRRARQIAAQSRGSGSSGGRRGGG
ncbi:hypothetical protein JW916_15690 [Candidatus Sumerlaeota bacterium]|nr:hypothetical protein [Candidatus Sumerlaeota bacterium]